MHQAMEAISPRQKIHSLHWSSKFKILKQTIQTPEQHKWLTKLLGFEFDIVYKPSAQNLQADALSRVHENDNPTH